LEAISRKSPKRLLFVHHKSRAARILPTSNYYQLKKYWWVIAIGELLLALKIRVRESVPKNFRMCAMEKNAFVKLSSENCIAFMNYY
jgi:hypothetical protein